MLQHDLDLVQCVLGVLIAGIKSERLLEFMLRPVELPKFRQRYAIIQVSSREIWI